MAAETHNHEQQYSDHDQVLILRGKVETLEKLVVGNVPERCVRNDQEIKNVKADIGDIKTTLGKIFERLDRPGNQIVTALINAGVATAIALIVSNIAK